MLPYSSRSPFGARRLTRAQITAQKAVDSSSSEKVVHKWTVFRDISAAKSRLALTDRALAILDALLSFHPDSTLSGGQLIVWPSNGQLRLRAHGIAEPTLRRHIAILVEAGVIIRRDSPNGKRYARKGKNGEIDKAFGFDLTPLVVRADEFAATAESVRNDEKTYRLARERVSLCRRDMIKLLAAADEQKLDVDAAREEFRNLLAALPRVPTPAQAEAVADELTRLANSVFNQLDNKEDSSLLNGNPAQDERHIHTSKTKPTNESEPAIETMVGPEAGTLIKPFKPKRDRYPLPMVLEACPDIISYTRNGVQTWRQFEVAAALVRSMLGISASAFAEAEAVLGDRQAAIVVACILQRAEMIQKAGGYLRALVGKAREGRFSPGPMLMALISARSKRQSA